MLWVTRYAECDLQNPRTILLGFWPDMVSFESFFWWQHVFFANPSDRTRPKPHTRRMLTPWSFFLSLKLQRHMLTPGGTKQSQLMSWNGVGAAWNSGQTSLWVSFCTAIESHPEGFLIQQMLDISSFLQYGCSRKSSEVH